jgi:spoIIIJ-associated protein
MDWVETTGRTVEEAKKLALEQLGVEESDAEFEVISEPKIGLFGRLKEEARVRARVQPRYPRSKGERRDRRRGRGAKQEQASVVPATSVTPTADDDGGAASPTARKRARAEDNQTRATSQPAARRRRKTGGTGATMDKADDNVSFTDAKTVTTEELASSAEAFLRGLLKELGTTAAVTSDLQADDAVEVLISGDDLGMLIGPKGATLLALQELTRIVLQRHRPPSESRVTVDINGYRRRRHEALARFAQQVATEVVATNKKRALEPMQPADRKVVHDAVNDIAGVTTVSEGEEPNRRVVLIPVADPEGAGEADLEDARS